jgi:serine protease Do
MKLVKAVSLIVTFAGLAVLAVVVVPVVHGQRPDSIDRAPHLSTLLGRGSQIGVSVRDVEPAERDRQKSGPGGVLVEEVRPDSPAAKAGIQRGDLIVEFDGERVRGARQFARAVQETPLGWPVKVVTIREGRRAEVQLTPESRWAGLSIDGDRLGALEQRLERLPFDFYLDPKRPRAGTRGSLGVTTLGLTGQLASYFGAREGVLVAEVADDSPAARAGVKAGDVITEVENEPIRSPADMVDAWRRAKGGSELSLGIVRERKEMSVTMKLERRLRPSASRRPA